MDKLIEAIAALEEVEDDDDFASVTVTQSCQELLKRPLVSAGQCVDNNLPPPEKKSRESYRFRDRGIIESVAQLNEKENKKLLRMKKQAFGFSTSYQSGS